MTILGKSMLGANVSILVIAGLLVGARPVQAETLVPSLGEPNETMRWVKFTESLAKVSNANWREYLQSFQDHHAKTGIWLQEHWALALTRIGEVAGKEALETWRKEEEPTGKFDKCWRGMVGYSSKDPSGAQKWWGALPEGEFKKQLVGAMTWGIAQTGPENMSEFFVNAPDWVQQKVGMDAVKALGVNFGFDAAAKFVAKWSEKIGRESDGPKKLFAEVIRQRMDAAKSEGKPEATCQWLNGHKGNLYLDSSRVKEAARAWAKKAPVDAFIWASSFPLNEADSPPSIAIAVAEAWADKDMNACLDYFLSHPEVSNSASIFGVARSMASKDLVEALGLSATIEQPALRARLEFQLRGIAEQAKQK